MRKSILRTALVWLIAPSLCGAFLVSPLATITTSTPTIKWRQCMADIDDDTDEVSVNVLGTRLQPCCTNVRDSGIGTGFYRNGYCSTGEQDLGRHTVCVQVTKDFLDFSRSVGNDLSTPFPEYMFPGLQDGDIWCLCAQRWVQAYEAGVAPQVYLQSTHEKTLTYAPFDVLREYAIDKDAADEALNELNAQRDRLKRLLNE
ncbi:DUF2237-containing protein [Fragilaria crotonensis]|nr:DUF2237-containing protein [Fragilaria crotonensis]